MTTVAQTVSGHGAQTRVVDGNKTSMVYTLLKDGKYAEAVKILNNELQSYPNSRAALSLLAYCHYYMQNFVDAAST